MSSLETNDIPKVKYCMHCGTLVDINSNFCTKCGKQLADIKTTEQIGDSNSIQKDTPSEQREQSISEAETNERFYYPNYPNVNNNKKARKTTKQCQNCKSDMPRVSSKCPKCGTNQGYDYFSAYFIANISVLAVAVLTYFISCMFGLDIGDSEIKDTFQESSQTYESVQNEEDIQNTLGTAEKANAKTNIEEAVEEELNKQPTVETTPSVEDKEKINAFKAAEQYLNNMPFSHDGLINQLVFDGFTEEDATFAVDNCGADWNEQASIRAKQYLETSGFSRSGLRKQLELEGFTAEQAEYGATAVGY